MQNDSVQFSTSGFNSQSNSPASPVKFYQCSHCPFTVKSKAYLFEHLNKVHNFDVDAALKNSGLKSNNSISSGSDLKCQSCDFIACSQDGLNDHLSRCPKKSKVPGLTGLHTSDKKTDAKIAVVSSFASSCSKLKSGAASSKNLKIYTKPAQTITKFFVTTSKPSGKSNTNNSQGSLKLEEASSSSKSSRSNSSVLQVNATSSIDINHVPPSNSLLNDELWIATLKKPKTKEGFEEEPPNNGGKRINSDNLENDLVKKPKLHTENATVSEKENTSKSKSYNSSDFSFELSEDEGETKRNPAHVNSAVYFCKHCDYSDVGVRSMSNHYKHNHPYIRSNAIYIQDSSDQSATFRCLECPVEFVSTASLKRHYKDHHPDAPNVFTKKSSELNLVFKCFLCPFNSTVLKNLKEHHDETHPRHEVSNALLYCRYSVTGSTKESSQLSKQDIRPPVEQMEDSTPEIGCLSQSEVKSTTSNPPQPTSKGADLALYKCSNCTFSHKSVVVMHVHYQRSHPEEAMTIDKIKQSARLKAHATHSMTPEKSENSATVLKKSAPLKSPPEPSKEERTEPSPLKDMKVDTCHSQSKSPNEASKKKNSKKLSIKEEQVFAQAEHKLNSPPTIETFYCRFCAFESDSLRSVVGHQNAKHFMQSSGSSDAICKYSAKMQKMKAQRQSEMSEISPPSHSETHAKIAGRCEAEDKRDTFLTEDPAYADPKKLFFCSKCNYANPSVKGIKYHQIKMHNGFFSEMDRVIQYSALVCKELDRTKSQPRELPFSTRLPLPLIHKRDRHKFFCHFCNYRHSDMAMVMKHYRTVHHGCHVKRTDINMYTSMVLKKGKKSRLKAAVKNKMNGETQDVTEKETKLSKTSTEKPPPQRTLKCWMCSYSTQYIYLLRRHFAKVHDKKQPATEILKDCFKQGALQSGYHCEYCVFTHKNGPTLYKHYKEHHLERKVSLNYVLTQLYVGPTASSLKNKQLEVTNAGMNIDSDSDGGLLSGQSQAKTYPCSECSFKGSSLSSVIEHFRTDHPWTEKHSPDVNDAPPLLDSFGEPLGSDWSADEDEEESPSGVFQCPFCPAVMKTHHGLSTHCGLKHQHDVSNTVGSTKKVVTRICAFKCQHCTYVNTSYQGAQAHGKRKHLDLTASPSSINVTMAQVQYLDSLQRDLCGMWKFRAHICTTCLLLYGTVNKLDRHRLKDHSGPAADAAHSNLTAASRPPIKCKILLPKIHAAQMLKMSKVLLNKKGCSVLRCQHCSYTCTTSVKLNQHVRVQHNKYTVSKGSLYKCVLCSKKYFKRKHLAGHYVMKHGKDAYLTHFVPAYMQPKLTAGPPASSSSQNQSESSSSKEGSTIQIYKCLFCPYVNVSYHGTLTHCQMKHPKVTVRADMLQTEQILLTSIAGGKIGRYSKQGGYMCKKCSQVCGSTAKFKLHCQARCRGTLDKSKILASRNFHRPASLDIDMKEEKSEVEIDAGQNPRLDPRETKPSHSHIAQDDAKIYKCHMCQYSGTHRRYLYGHYRNFHKLHTEMILKLLQKYNKPNLIVAPGQLKPAKPEEIPHTKCVKCPEMTFDSSELLLEHYCTFHCSDVKLDFTVLSTGEKKKSTGLYRCSHCFKQLNGTRKLTHHMIGHNELEKARRGASLQGLAPDPIPIEPGLEDEVPTLESVEELTRRSMTAADLLPSPDVKQSAPESYNKRHACRQCGRSFMSPKVLLSHERSHSTVAAIKNFSNLSIALDSSFSKYVIYKAGNTRPFTCSICNYRTTVLGLWWSHFQKRHQDVIVDPTKAVSSKDVAEEDIQNVDAEPPNLLMHADNSADPGNKPAAAQNSLYLEPPDVRRQLNHYNVMVHRNAEELRLCTDSVLHCELCSFNTEHLSSIRRHYMNRHGKKIIRCKQCDFFTESRKVLEMHVTMGHSTCQSLPTHLKDLRCPFCLYQTKNKNNMIDHIDLHRDKRVVPIEVRRPKLSRYLQGVVFRCHRCTFMSGSVENLRLHMARHDGVRPYKCRLCFFDCAQLSDLEAHLSDKHQVERNHELVGQVSLDQLEMRSVPSVEEGPLSSLELCSNHSEDEETEEPLTDASDALQAGNQDQGQRGDGEKNPDQTVLSEHEKHTSDPQAGISSERGQDGEDGDRVKTCRSPERCEEDQAGFDGDRTGGGEMDESLPPYSNTTGEEKKTEAQRATDMETSIEDDILRNILLLDEDNSVYRTFNKSNPDVSPAAGQNVVAQSQNCAIPVLAKVCQTQASDAEGEKSSSSCEDETLPPSILPSSCHDEDFPTCKLEQEDSGENSSDTLDPGREMPVLENEFLKGKMRLLESCREEQDGDHLEQEEEEDDAKSFKDEDSPDELKENAYGCELCGRKLASSSELKLHVVRHGM